MHLSNKTILITGGNSGIGFELVKQLNVSENLMVVVSRSKNRWDFLRDIQPRVSLLQCDLSSKSSVLQLIQELKTKSIAPDVLINCAAVQNSPTLIDPVFDFDSIETETTINFIAPVWLSHQLLPDLQNKDEAIIVNITSGLALYPKTTSAIYCATKAAMHNFSQCLRYQLAETSVSVKEIILPLVDTPMTQGRGKGKLPALYVAKEIAKAITGSRDEIYLGKARLLPVMSRIWPSLIKRILQSY
ncbi:MAG: SDR family NAD(P)-dependent oxidoreductase [Gammaproteobacteria bacterium]|nr:SDR family NAD(P)-dependent oxidoreductase [Gammaproteobacteria bacterium]MDH5730449.1 SDR family NAD(P)-dependent oxidoreductase [Gammaproteobacteria bacterium]